VATRPVEAIFFLATLRPLRASRLAELIRFGAERARVDTFLFVNKEGVKQAGRYQIVPVAGQRYLTDAEAKVQPPNFLLEELRTHLAHEPVKFRLRVQVPNPGDPTNDASIVWEDDRRTVDMGTIIVTSVVSDSDEAQKALAFYPTRLADGIEASDDPLPALRSRVYRLSRIHRQSQ